MLPLESNISSLYSTQPQLLKLIESPNQVESEDRDKTWRCKTLPDTTSPTFPFFSQSVSRNNLCKENQSKFIPRAGRRGHYNLHYNLTWEFSHKNINKEEVEVTLGQTFLIQYSDCRDPGVRTDVSLNFSQPICPMLN